MLQRTISINEYRVSRIEDQARQLLDRLWKREQAVQGKSINPLEMLPIDPAKIAKLLGLEMIETWDIGLSSKAKAIGAMDSSHKRIHIARELEAPIRRFTLAHEVGHHILHPNLLQLREDPATDSAIRSELRTPREREADIFAAALIMPGKLVLKMYERFFGAPIDGDDLTEDQAFAVVGERYRASELAKMNPTDRATLVASSSSLVGSSLSSLAETFGVSAIAMGIRLLRLQLVR